MRHEAETDGARFLGGDLPAPEREAFSRHLLTCGACWQEVELGRQGRALAEATRTVAPGALRDRVRALVDAESVADSASASPVAGRRRQRRTWRVPALVTAGAAAGLALILVFAGGTTEPPSLRQAVADFTAGRLPGAQLPAAAAPDLSRLRLQSAGAGGGSYAGLGVDGFAYRDAAGHRVVVYLSDEPFPEAPGARHLAGNDGPWVVQRGDLTLLCARLPHALLVVGQDDQLVRSTATALGVR